MALAVLHGALAPVVTPELLHVGELDGWPYLVMTRLEATSLRTWGRGSLLPSRPSCLGRSAR